MSLTAWGTVAAIVVSLVSLALAVRADRRAARADTRGRRSNLVVKQTHGGEGVAGQLLPRRFDFSIRNVGAFPAWRVELWLVDSAKRKVSSNMTDISFVIAPGDPAREGSVDLHEPVETSELQVWLKFVDGVGPQEGPLVLPLY